MTKTPLVVHVEDYTGYRHVASLLRHIIDNLWRNCRTGTYEDACQALEIDSRGLAIRHALGRIQQICDTHGWPRLNYLIVSKADARPGDWVETNEERGAPPSSPSSRSL